MSKLAKMQEAKTEKLRLLSLAGRNQLEEALEQQNPSAEANPDAEPDAVPPAAVPQPKEPRLVAFKREAYWENGGSKQRVIANLDGRTSLRPHLESLIDRTAKALERKLLSSPEKDSTITHGTGNSLGVCCRTIRRPSVVYSVFVLPAKNSNV